MKTNKKKLDYSEYYQNGGITGVDTTIPSDIREKIYDKNGERRIDSDAISVLTEYSESIPQTKDKYFDYNTNLYSEERQKLHQQIINDFKEDLICVENNNSPIAILMGGSPASGKSTFLKKYAPYLLQDEILKVDADEIRSKLPEYRGWNASSTHLETRDIVNTLLSDRVIGIPCKYDIIYDGTMNSVKNYEPLIKLLKSLGYKIFIVYMDKVTESDVKKRALERYKKSGRFVPMAVIDDFFSKGKTAFNKLKNEIDGYMVVDGSTPEYKIIEKGGMALPKHREYSKLGVPISQLKLLEKGESIDDQDDDIENVTSKKNKDCTSCKKKSYLDLLFGFKFF